jgi:DNA-binding LacI/PurR family transcriptional regulator
MNPVPRPSVPELTAAHLREGLLMGRWSGTLPGAARLAKDLDVAPATIRAALHLLEAEGLITGRGLGRSRGIVTRAARAVAAPLRVAILRHDARPTEDPQTSAVLTEIVHSLEATGHRAFLSGKSQIDLRHDVRRIAGEMKKNPADAWVIEAGSRELLEWCAEQPIPCLALYGRAGGLALAGTGADKVPAYRSAVRHLIELGHRRIVLIVRATRREPIPGAPERAFLEELAAHGVATSEYNLPKWEENPVGFYKLLESLFLHSPPTALFVDEPARFIATMEFLARRGIKVPEQVSLVSPDDDPAFAWCHYGIARMQWDKTHLVNRVVRWANAVSKGKPDRKVIKFSAEFVPGGSIGPVWKG